MRTRLRHRTSFVGLGKDNRGVMRIVIDIKLESCYIGREAEREREREREEEVEEA